MLTTPVAANSSPTLPAVQRSLIWFHHIKSLTKRKNIVAWAHELRIGGYSKPGFPGIIICEGQQEDVAEYVHRIRQMRWQAMSVRAEQLDHGDVSPNDLPSQPSASLQHCAHLQASAAGKVHADDPIRMPRRLFATSFTELPERGMDQLAAACQAAGLEELFLASMKIAK